MELNFEQRPVELCQSTEKNPRVNEHAQFQPMLLKGHCTFLLHTFNSHKSPTKMGIFFHKETEGLRG